MKSCWRPDFLHHTSWTTCRRNIQSIGTIIYDRYHTCDLAQSRNTMKYSTHAGTRLQQPVTCAPAAPPGPGVTMDHCQASPGPPGAASGPYNATKGIDLATARSHWKEVRKRRSRGRLMATLLAAKGAPRARRTRPVLPYAAQPSAAAAARLWRPLGPTRALCGPHGRLHC